MSGLGVASHRPLVTPRLSAKAPLTVGEQESQVDLGEAEREMVLVCTAWPVSRERTQLALVHFVHSPDEVKTCHWVSKEEMRRVIY